LDLQDYDLIISSSSSFAKAVKEQGTAHLLLSQCYPILWDTRTYLKEYGDYRYFYPLIDTIFQIMRKVDLAYAQEPDLYIANSSVVAYRIQDNYGKHAIVINYPINTSKFIFSEKKKTFIWYQLG